MGFGLVVCGLYTTHTYPGLSSPCWLGYALKGVLVFHGLSYFYFVPGFGKGELGGMPCVYTNLFITIIIIIIVISSAIALLGSREGGTPSG